jgi:choline dehydrogenase-like flavoprotein
VLDPDCRLFGQPNVFVVDGSFFPTSLGVGPALTIMANALRVARVVVREL